MIIEMLTRCQELVCNIFLCQFFKVGVIFFLVFIGEIMKTSLIFNKILYVFSFLFLCSCFNVNAASYKLIDLGLLSYDASVVTGINNRGQVTGVYVKDSKHYVFFWDKTLKCTRVYNADGAKINNNSNIFGSYLAEKCYSSASSSYCFHAGEQRQIFSWHPIQSDKYQSLGSPLTIDFRDFALTIWDTNDIDQVLVMDTDVIDLQKARKTRGQGIQTWVYHNGVFNLLKSEKITGALRINNNSKILAWHYVMDGWFCSKVETVIYDYNTKETKVLDFEDSAYGMDINDKNQVVGVFFDQGQVKGFFGDPQGSDFIVLDNIQAKSVNNRGQILGTFSSGANKDKYVIWDQGKETKLSEISLVDNEGHLWQSLDTLVDINDQGQIIGEGIYKGKSLSFLLEPVE